MMGLLFIAQDNEHPHVPAQPALSADVRAGSREQRSCEGILGGLIRSGVTDKYLREFERNQNNPRFGACPSQLRKDPGG